MVGDIEIDGLLWTEALPGALHLVLVRHIRAERLDEIARELGIALPARYLSLASSVQGRCPSRASFVVWDISESRVGTMPELGSGQLRDIASFAVLALETSSPWLGNTVGTQLVLLTPGNPGLFPFAFDLRGNLLCLDYGEHWTDQVPSVVYYDRARSTGDDVFPVSSDFSTFLSALSESAAEPDNSAPNEG